MSPIRRPDLAEYRAAPQHDVGDTELPADFDQLASRDDDLATVGQCLERQQHGGGVVVDDQGVLGTGQPTQHRLHVAVAGAALLPDEVELEIRIRGGDRLEPLERERAQERPAKVGVEHDALRIDDGP